MSSQPGASRPGAEHQLSLANILNTAGSPASSSVPECACQPSPAVPREARLMRAATRIRQARHDDKWRCSDFTCFGSRGPQVRILSPRPHTPRICGVLWFGRQGLEPAARSGERVVRRANRERGLRRRSPRAEPDTHTLSVRRPIPDASSQQRFRVFARLDVPRFVTLPAPRTTDIQKLVSVIARRVKRLLRRRGLLDAQPRGEKAAPRHHTLNPGSKHTLNFFSAAGSL